MRFRLNVAVISRLIFMFYRLKSKAVFMVPKLNRRIKDLWHTPSEPIEIFGWFMLSLLGTLLLLPGEDTYYSTNKVWAGVHTVIPNEVLAGSFMLVLGTAILIGVLLKHRWIRRVTSFVASGLFLFVMGSFMFQSVYSAWPIFLTCAIAAAWVFIRQGRSW